MTDWGPLVLVPARNVREASGSIRKKAAATCACDHNVVVNVRIITQRLKQPCKLATSKGGLECNLTEITVPFSGIMRWLALNETLEIWKILLDWLE